MIEHKHIIVRAECEQFFSHNEETEFVFWINDLIHGLKMNIMKGPIVAYNSREGLEGWSGVAIIETSHVAIHVWDHYENKNDPKAKILVQLDVYTCGEMNEATVLSSLEEFGVRRCQAKIFDRENDLIETHQIEDI
jgi:S-adenosylmethionine/arginine decarboxylase-like enzyme